VIANFDPFPCLSPTGIPLHKYSLQTKQKLLPLRTGHFFFIIDYLDLEITAHFSWHQRNFPPPESSINKYLRELLQLKGIFKGLAHLAV
jgi:hypothetical protein